MAMSDFFFEAIQLAGELRRENSGEFMTRGELAGVLERLVEKGSTSEEELPPIEEDVTKVVRDALSLPSLDYDALDDALDDGLGGGK